MENNKEELLEDIKELLEYIYHSDEKYYDAVDFSKDEDFMKIYHKYMESEEERIVREEKEKQYLLDLQDDKIKLEYEIESLENELLENKKKLQANKKYVENLEYSINNIGSGIIKRQEQLRSIEYNINYEKGKAKKEI